jgi:ribonucleotide monophosphatase NagD (HAD superfamily)
LRPFAAASESPEISLDARKFLSGLERFIIVTGNTTRESAACIARLEWDFPRTMIAAITPNTIILDILDAGKTLYCIADPEDRDVIRESFARSAKHRETRILFADDPIHPVDCVFVSSWRWIDRQDMEKLSAILTISGARDPSRAPKLPVVSATADGYEYTEFINGIKIKVPGTKRILPIIAESFPGAATRVIGKPNIKNELLSQATIMIGDSTDTDMRQPIAPGGIHIHIRADASGERYMRKVPRDDVKKEILTDFEASDIGMLMP